MSAALRTDEPILKGVHRIMLERLEHTLNALERRQLSDENVHSIRKELKRMRASLRLLREPLGITAYRRLNRTVRDAARRLTPVRDTTVLLQALENTIKHNGTFSRTSAIKELRHSLQQERRLNRTQLTATAITAIRRRLNTVKRSLQHLSGSRLDQADVNIALKHAHKKSRKAFKAVKREPRDDNLHEWRKQVKYEFNQLELLQPLKPRDIGAIIGQAHQLSDHLGDDHDLAMLYERIAAQSQQTKSAAADADAVLKALKHMRAKLQRKAHRLGKPLYANTSKQKKREVSLRFLGANLTNNLS